jgi:hypothetical protein
MALRRSVLRWLYSRLTRSDEPNPADLIFVFAGKMERKQYGLELYRANVAGRLILSIGRFEVSKMAALDFAGLAELFSLRDHLPPDQRHFFCDIDGRQTRISNPHLRKWNTYGEALGLREHLTGDPVKRVIVVSSDIHLRRVALILQRVVRASRVTFQYCPVPAHHSSVSADKWWTCGEDRRYVISETLKLAAYRAILLMPEFVVRRCLRLQD